MADRGEESEEISSEDDDILTPTVIEKYKAAGTIAQGFNFAEYL